MSGTPPLPPTGCGPVGHRTQSCREGNAGSRCVHSSRITRSLATALLEDGAVDNSQQSPAVTYDVRRL